jgi:hypothetical protein
MSGAFARLSGELGRAMAGGGVPGALRFCSVEAMPLTDAAGEASNVEIRRFSHRPRNPANGADAVQGGKIAGWQAAIAAGGSPGPDVEAVGFRMGDTRGGWEIRLDRKALVAAP